MGVSVASPKTIPKLVLLQTLSPSGSASVATSALAVYSRYRVEWELYGPSGEVRLTINSDGGANYTFNKRVAASVSQTTGAAYISLVATDANVLSVGSFDCAGLTPAAASAVITLNIQSTTNAAYSGPYPSDGYWVAGSAVQVSTFTFTASSLTFTGTIRIYGVRNE